MRGGRARHKNETFNTLQGYQFEHNFGHGNQHLSTVFAHLMLLAFFVDQLQQLGCKLFTKALERLYSNLFKGKVESPPLDFDGAPNDTLSPPAVTFVSLSASKTSGGRPPVLLKVSRSETMAFNWIVFDC